MKKTILFSPVGMTDPIRYFHDGAMLNIIRNYKPTPDIVYLYMSKEICEQHEKDDRYRYSIRQLGKTLNKEIDIVLIERPELEDVQLFDSFINEFSSILNDIHSKHPDYEIILNVSSGTPAMKSSLQILSLTLDYATVPVQVSTPQKQSNPRIDDEKNATCEELWELNDSNNGNDDRCIISGTKNLLTEFKKNTLKKLIKSYDYPAALELAKDMSIFSDRFIDMLSAANDRLKLKYFSTKTVFKKYDYNISINAKKEFVEIHEYVMLLKIKIIKEEYADFIRAITPLNFHLFELFLREKCSIDVNNYAEIKNKGVRYWSKCKLSGTDIDKCLNGLYNSGFRYDTAMNSDTFCGLIEKYSGDDDISKCAKNLRDIETNIRNKAAHTIVSVTDKDIKDDTGFKSDEIFEMIINMLKYSGFDISSKCIKSYDTMNEYLINEM